MAIKYYPFNSKEKVSPHFKVSEFRCKCGRTHTVPISTELVEKLETLYEYIGASKGIISSGHRCAAHDRAVGGSGGGMHTKGYAIDIIFYDKNNKPIDTKYISCVAQDLGFKGIANITMNYEYIHLDMGGRIYRGNEDPSINNWVPNYNTVTSDFYKYYKLTKTAVLKKFGKEAIPETPDVPVNNKDKNVTLVWSNKRNNAIKDLQKILNSKGAKLDVDGIAGDKTYTELKKYTINKNDRGPLVAWVQTRLTSLKFKPGIADGIAGVNTMNAIKEFQKKNNLGQGYLGGTDWYFLIK